MDYLTAFITSVLLVVIFHLPTLLFFRISLTDIEQKLLALDINVYSDINLLDNIIMDKLAYYYSDFLTI